jgi:hypothetical protein
MQKEQRQNRARYPAVATTGNRGHCMEVSYDIFFQFCPWDLIGGPFCPLEPGELTCPPLSLLVLHHNVPQRGRVFGHLGSLYSHVFFCCLAFVNKHRIRFLQTVWCTMLLVFIFFSFVKTFFPSLMDTGNGQKTIDKLHHLQNEIDGKVLVGMAQRV